MEKQCEHCQNPFPDIAHRCPACNSDQRPNVNVASRPEEVVALEQRYQAALQALLTTGRDVVRQEFEQNITAESRAVISIPFNELIRLASSETQLFSTFYQRVAAGMQIPKGGKWDAWRGVVESAVFPGFKEHIRFAALSLTEEGVKNYGECFVTLKEPMIADRTTVFEDNNVRFIAEDLGTPMLSADQLPTGYRATWHARERLCTAKLHAQLQPGMNQNDFQRILLVQGRTTNEDRFVEVHIWGSLSIRSVASVQIHRKGNRPLKTAIRDLEKQLQQWNIPVVPA